MTGQPIQLDPASLLREEAFVRRLARGLLFDEHRVDDVVQETWIAAMRATSGSPPTRSPRALLSKIVRRKAIDEIRSSTRRRQREEAVAERLRQPESVTEAADEALAREELRQRIVEELRGLESPFREAVVLRYLEGLEPSEIATRQNLNPATVRSRIARGLEKIRARLDASHGGRRRDWCLGLVPLAVPTKAEAATALAVTTLSIPIWLQLAAVALLSLGAYWAIDSGDRATTDAPPRIATARSNAPSRDTLTDPGSTREDVDGDITRQDSTGGPVAPSPTSNTGRFAGRLLDPEGLPMPGASLQFVTVDGPRLFVDPSGLFGATTTTRDDGTFLSPPLPATADCAVLADKGGDLQQLILVPQTVSYSADTELGDLRLEPRGTLEGRVLDQNGHPLADAEVFATDLPALLLAALPVHRFRPEHGALFFTPRLGDRSAADLSRSIERMLRRIGLDTLRDFDSDEHQPVVLTGGPVLPIWDALPIPRARTDGDGRFRLGGLPRTPQTVVITAEGHQTWSRGSLTVTTATAEQLGTITLRGGSELSGRVLAPDGTPVAQAELRLAPLGIAGFRGVTPCSASITSDGEGRFEFSGLDRGRVLVLCRRGPGHMWSVSDPQSSDSVVEVRVADSIEHHLALESIAADEIARIEVRPSPPMGELASLEVTEAFRPLELHAESDSELLLTDLEPGTWTLRVTTRDGRWTTAVVDLPSQEPTKLALASPQAVTLEVVDTDGRPVEGAEVFVRPADDPELFRVLPSRYGLALWNDRLPVRIGSSDHRGILRIHGLSAEAEIFARSARGGLGSVAYDGTPTAKIRLCGQGHLVGQVGLPERTDSASRLRVQLRPTVVGPNARARARRLLEDMALAEPGSEAGAESIVPGPVAPTTTRVLALDENGGFEALGVPPGLYQLELLPALPLSLTMQGLFEHAQSMASVFRSRTDPMVSQTVEIVAGETTRARLELISAESAPGRVEGRVFCNGQPLAGARIYSGPTEADPDWVSFEDRPRAVTDADGRFEIATMESGPRAWAVRTTSHDDIVGQTHASVPSGDTLDLNWSLDLGSAAIRLRTASGQLLPRTEILIFREEALGNTGAGVDARTVTRAFRRTADDGALARFDGVSVGRYTVACAESSLRHDRTEIEVLPDGRSVVHDLVVTPSCGLELQFIDPNQVLGTLASDAASSLWAEISPEDEPGRRAFSGTLGLQQVWWRPEPGLYRLNARIGSHRLILSETEFELTPSTTIGEPQRHEVQILGLEQDR